MPSFPLSSAGSVPGGGWRPLRFKAPMLNGWDVYDLQRKLNYLGATPDGPLAPDGWFGASSKKAVQHFQAQVSPQAGPLDGIAGVQTQVILGKYCCAKSAMPQRVRGQMEKETSLLCGVYTPTYENGSQDTGPLQMNTQYHENLNQNFDVQYAIRTLVARITEYHAKYARWGVPDPKAWDAAQGSWNSPMYADRYARGENVPQSFRDYVAAVSLYAH